ncbi:MAG: RIP metalloprotease RseP [Dehalococcoidales bacterium]|jgi:regulator of sigma E protease|nr:RIP metalloprotease RseP [Dehalococcoidales bacterium]
MSILIAFLALLIVVAVAALIYKYNIFNRRELPLMVVIVATLAYFLLAIIAVIAGELAGSNVVIPGIGTLTTIVAFFFVLAIVVIAHELGHFATAKACGVRVDEFGIGFPPRIIALKYGETEYSLNWVPLGGFTKMAGEEDPNIERSLASKSIGKRLLVLSAGSIMNFILPFLLLTMAFMIPHDIVTGNVSVVEVVADSPAETAGIQAGDKILEINDKSINNTADISRYIQMNLGNEMTILLERSDGSKDTVTVVPRWNPPAGDGSVGFSIRTDNAAIEKRSYNPWVAFQKGATEAFETMVLFKNGILSMFIGTSTTADLVGPVGIAQITGQVAQAGISPLLEWTAFFSLNLAIINLLPLPALDGGRIIFVLLEWIRRGKKVAPETEGKIHFLGFALLIMLMVAITFQDIGRIIGE